MSQRGESKRSMRKRVTVDDATAEAVLSGRPLGRNELADDLADVVGVMAEMRALGDRASPVLTPSAALARLFVEGDSSPMQSGAEAGHPAMGGARLRRLSVRTRLVVASLASLGVIGVAGAAGALPAPAQHALARAVRQPGQFDPNEGHKPIDCAGFMSVLVEVSFAGRSGFIRRPSLLGAIVAKACAVVVDDAPVNQELDLALLLSLVADPFAMRDELAAKDRQRLWSRRAMTSADHRVWSHYSRPEADIARTALAVLLGAN